ncbi:hypothetical protein LUX32_12990 [Actinomadura madurae]|nr:hypothetical protein [Actinomadura madurae]MCP9978423.1 hypothetical protein [Actinomadura madurae]
MGALPVRRRPSTRKSTPHSSPRPTRTDNAPDVSVAASSSTDTSPAGSVANSKWGPRRRSPAKWVRVTPMTSGIGDSHVTVTTGPLSRSPRCRIRCTGAYTRNEPGPASTSRTSTG